MGSNFHKAMSESDEGTLKNLISNQNISIDVTDFREKASLMNAIENSDTAMIKLLLDDGTTHDNKCYTDHFGPLHLAAREGNYDAVKILIEADADVNTADKLGNTPLHSAVSVIAHERTIDKRPAITDVLLESGAEKNATNKLGESPLHLAISNRQFKAASILLDADARATTADNNGRTPLHLSAKTGNVNLTKRLIKKGANASATDRDKFCPFCYALKSKNVEIMKMLAKYGVPSKYVDRSFFNRLLMSLEEDEQQEVNDKIAYFLSCLRRISEYGKERIMEKLLKRVHEINTVHIYESYIYERCMPSLREFTNFLDEMMIAPRATDLNLTQLLVIFTPITHHLDTETLRDFMGKLLNASGNIMESMFKFVYLATEKSGDTRLFKLLADSNEHFDTMTIGSEECTALHYISDRSRFQSSASCLKHLLKKGYYDANLRNGLGVSLLHVATDSANADCIELLLQYGADVNVKVEGKLPLAFAHNGTGAYWHGVSLPELLAPQRYDDQFARERQTMLVLIRHIALLESLAKPVDPQNYRIIQSQQDMTELLEQCRRELKSMRQRKVYKSTTLYDVLTKAAQLNCRDRNFRAALTDDRHLEGCLLYRDIVARNIEGMRKRSRLLQQAEPILHEILRHYVRSCPASIAEIILRYLDDRDLQKFTKRRDIASKDGKGNTNGT